MGASNTSQNSKFYNLKQKASKTDDPLFWLAEKINGSWVQSQSFNTISGLMNDAKIVEKDFGASGKQNVFVLTMEDENEKMIVTMPHGNITYSIINSLASNINKLDTYTIGVYKKQKNDKWFGGGSVKCGTENTKWLIDPSTAPKPEPIIDKQGKPLMQNGMPMKDYTEQRAFWEKFFTENIMSRLSISPAKSEVLKKSTDTNTMPIGEDEFEGDDLPF